MKTVQPWRRSHDKMYTEKVVIQYFKKKKKDAKTKIPHIHMHIALSK
jgi:hypothetical protein